MNAHTRDLVRFTRAGVLDTVEISDPVPDDTADDVTVDVPGLPAADAPWTQRRPRRPAPDRVRGRVLIPDGASSAAEVARAGIAVELIRRDAHRIVPVDRSTTAPNDDGEPEYIFIIVRPGAYAVRIPHEEAQRFGRVVRTSATFCSFTSGTTYRLDLRLIRRL